MLLPLSRDIFRAWWGVSVAWRAAAVHAKHAARTHRTAGCTQPGGGAGGGRVLGLRRQRRCAATAAFQAAVRAHPSPEPIPMRPRRLRLAALQLLHHLLPLRVLLQ